MANFSRSMSRRQSLPYAPPMDYSFPDQGYSYGDQGYSHGENYSGMYADPRLQQGAEYPQSSYPIYGPQAGLVPQSHRLTGPSYEDLSLGRESYYADDMQLPVTRNALTPMVGFGNTSRPRHRRHSTVSYSALPPMVEGGYRSPSSMHIKFKRKGAILAGINLSDAQSTRTRLSGNDAYTIHDLHADWRRRIHLRVRWAGYAPLTYEVPLDVYDGRVSMQALSRRVARACVHYLQMNMVPVMYSRIELHHLEEISYGVWQPMLSTR